LLEKFSFNHFSIRGYSSRRELMTGAQIDAVLNMLFELKGGS